MFGLDFLFPFVKTCPSSPKNVGEYVHLKGSVSGGTAPYNIVFSIDQIPIEGGTFNGIAEGVEVSMDYLLLSSDVGSKLFSMAATDSCSKGKLSAPVETCTVTVNNICVSPSCAFTTD